MSDVRKRTMSVANLSKPELMTFEKEEIKEENNQF